MSQPTSDTFKAQPREALTKGHARRLRRSGWIPASAYGPKNEPVSLAVDPKSFLLARREFGPSYVYNVEVEGGESFKAVVRSVARDPLSRNLLHIDLYRPDFDKPIKQKVDIVLNGKAKGETMGGRVRQILRKLKVECLPANLPQQIEIDVSDLDIEDCIRVRDLTLPEGVIAKARGDVNIVDVIAGRGAKKAAEQAEAS